MARYWYAWFMCCDPLVVGALVESCRHVGLVKVADAYASGFSECASSCSALSTSYVSLRGDQRYQWPPSVHCDV